MVKAKFNVGDCIVPIEETRSLALDKLIVQRVDSKNYYCKILCGTAIIPIKSAERLYKKIKV